MKTAEDYDAEQIACANPEKHALSMNKVALCTKCDRIALDQMEENYPELI